MPRFYESSKTKPKLHLKPFLVMFGVFLIISGLAHKDFLLGLLTGCADIMVIVFALSIVCAIARWANSN